MQGEIGARRWRFAWFATEPDCLIEEYLTRSLLKKGWRPAATYGGFLLGHRARALLLVFNEINKIRPMAHLLN